ncbi:MAG TPA: response regulator [Terriglobia bacterium]|nr:response regulator [Terriglobia bacterium]
MNSSQGNSQDGERALGQPPVTPAMRPLGPVGEITYRVLVVDDEPGIRQILARLLMGAGYVVRTAADGIEAVAKLRGGNFNLVITDLRMPRMSGWEFSALLRRRFPQIPVIALSGDVAPEEMPARVAADMYMQKDPAIFAELLPSISDLIRNPPDRAAGRDISHELKWPTEGSDGHTNFTCGDCLRSFQVQASGQSWRGLWTTVCPHCGGMVRLPVASSESR